MSKNRVANWMLVRGIFGIIFGCLIFLQPIAAVITLSYLFAVYVLVSGATALISSFEQYRSQERWGILFFQGIVGVLAGFGALVFPGVALFTLVFLIGAWGTLTGISELSYAYTDRNQLSHPVWLGVIGLCTLTFGLSILFWPAIGVSLMISFVGAYAMISGVLMVAWGFEHRRSSHKKEPPLQQAFGH